MAYPEYNNELIPNLEQHPLLFGTFDRPKKRFTDVLEHYEWIDSDIHMAKYAKIFQLLQNNKHFYSTVL